MKVVIAAGGSGGHIFPAIALSQKLEKRSGIEIIFAASKRALDKKILREASYKKFFFSINPMPYGPIRKHEFVLSGAFLKGKGLRTIDVAKRLIDHGFHPPTVYFPLIVEEALMIEPTETESRRDLDAFADAMLAIAQEADTDPQLLHDAPHNAPVRRVDEVYGARNPVYKWQDVEPGEEG